MPKENFVDFSEAYKALNKVGKNADSIVAKAINKSAEIGEQELTKRTPYWKGKKYSSADQSYKKEHMQKHTTKSKATKGKHEALIGFDEEVSWRVHFTELGTIKQKPQRFIEKTMKDIEKEVESIILQAMKEVFLK
nr:MAG TPA: type I neck protein [Caudoviricetes sp.]